MSINHTPRWVPIPFPADDPTWTAELEAAGPLDRAGIHVVVRDGRNQGRTGTVVAYGRAAGAHEHWTAEHGEPVTCTYGDQCDALVDSEGPLVRFDDQDPGDESLHWYPGQSMGVLAPAGGTEQ